MKKRLGVVVGRFHVPMLHEGHRHVIDTAYTQSDHVIICIGDTGGYPTPRNPLTYEARRAMVHEVYPDATVVMIRDQWNATVWSRLLDRIITANGGDCAERVLLFGSRDSFLAQYNGIYQTVAVDAVVAPSGTGIRQMIADGVYSGAGLERAGQILYQMTRPPLVYAAVGVAIVDSSRRRVLLNALERDDDHARFIEVPVMFTDTSLVDVIVQYVNDSMHTNVRRVPTIVGSAFVDDPRYKGSDDTVMMTLFYMTLDSDVLQCDRYRWVDISALPYTLVDEQKTLGYMLLTHLNADV